MYQFYNKWLFFVILVVLFGSAFSFIDISLELFSPLFIAFTRVFISTIILFCICNYLKISFNFFYKNFFLIFILALTGTTIPFTFISWAQNYIDSSVTGILIGFMPLFTIIGSSLIGYEKLTLFSIFGFIIGFVGILILSLDSISSLNLSNSLPQIAVIFSALMYSINALLIKKLSHINILPLSTTVMLVSSMQLILFLPFTDHIYIEQDITNYSPILSLLFLSVFCTAIATVIYYKIIKNSGPNFLSLVNYPVPIFAVFLGVTFLDEKLEISSIIALALVLIGIYISQVKSTNSR